MVVIVDVMDDERGNSKVGYVPREDFMKGNVWAVESQWTNPPKTVMKVAVIPLPEEYQ